MQLEISNPAKYFVGLYVRLSKEDENEGPSESVNNQLSLLHTFVKERQLQVIDTFIDDGFSGTRFDRPGFQRLIAAIESKQVNMVITKDLSRLGRDYIQTGYYMEQYFPEHRVRYISLLDGIDTGIESTANDITPFRAIMNDMYAKDISKKIKSVKHDKQCKGLFIGGKPLYGYQLSPTEKNEIVIDPCVAPIVQRIFGLALEGISCRQIAAQLNQEKIPTPATYAGLHCGRKGTLSGLWSGERISDMLQNETYIGNMVQGRSKKINYKSKKCIRQNREDWIIVPHTHPALIDTTLFQKVQRLIQSRQTTRSRSYEYLIKGLIFCHECGHPLGVINRKTASGQDCLYFICRTYQRSTKDSICTCHAIKVQTVINSILSKLQELFHSYLNPDLLLPLAEDVLHHMNSISSADPNLLHKRLQSLTNHLDNLYMDKLSGLLAEQDFTRLYKKITQERATLVQLLQHPPAIQEEGSAPVIVKQFMLTAWQQKDLLFSLIERIELTAQKKVLLYFRCSHLQ